MGLSLELVCPAGIGELRCVLQRSGHNIGIIKEIVVAILPELCYHSAVRTEETNGFIGMLGILVDILPKCKCIHREIHKSGPLKKACIRDLTDNYFYHTITFLLYQSFRYVYP